MDDNEAYWAGLIVSVIMLGSGFSLLLTGVFTGFGAVILSLGVMTMILVLMTKAVITQIQKWMDYNARIEETVASILALKKEGIVVPAKPQVGSDTAKSEEAETEAEDEITA